MTYKLHLFINEYFYHCIASDYSKLYWFKFRYIKKKRIFTSQYTKNDF